MEHLINLWNTVDFDFVGMILGIAILCFIVFTSIKAIIKAILGFVTLAVVVGGIAIGNIQDRYNIVIGEHQIQMMYDGKHYSIDKEFINDVTITKDGSTSVVKVNSDIGEKSFEMPAFLSGAVESLLESNGIDVERVD